MTEREFVQDLPDLIDAAEYSDHPDGRMVRLRITANENGVSVVADAFRPLEVERLMDHLGGGPVQQMLCG